MLQLATSERTHAAPPWAAGVSATRVLVWVPPPHKLSHAENAPHVPGTQSTGAGVGDAVAGVGDAVTGAGVGGRGVGGGGAGDGGWSLYAKVEDSPQVSETCPAATVMEHAWRAPLSL